MVIHSIPKRSHPSQSRWLTTAPPAAARARSLPDCAGASPRPSGESDAGAIDRIVRACGAFDGELRETTLEVARLSMAGCADAGRVRRRVSALAGDLLQLGMDASPDGLPPGCIPALRFREAAAGQLHVELYTEKLDAPCARWLSDAARAIAGPVARLAECRVEPTLALLRSDMVRVTVRCRLDVGGLARTLETLPLGGAMPSDVAGLGELLQRFAADSHQPWITARHNEAVIEAMLATALARGSDPTALERAARDQATRWGSCEPLVTWRRRGSTWLGQLKLSMEAAAVPSAMEHATEAAEPDGATGSSEALLEIASAGLSASLGSFRSGVFAPPPAPERRHLRPQPLGRHPSASPEHAPQRPLSSESGVHPIPSQNGGSFSRTA